MAESLAECSAKSSAEYSPYLDLLKINILVYLEIVQDLI